MPDEGFTELTGERVVLRRFHPGDVPEFVAYRSSPAVSGYSCSCCLMKRSPSSRGYGASQLWNLAT